MTAREVEQGDRVRILRPLTVVELVGRVRTVAHGSSRPYGVQLRDLTYLFLSKDEVEWTR